MVYLSPVGLSTTALTANQLSVLVSIREAIGRIKPEWPSSVSASVSYSYGTPVLSTSTVFVPVIATVNVSVPGLGNSVKPLVFTERFNVAFQGQTAVPTSVTIASVGTSQGVSSASKRGAVYSIDDSITVTIA